MNTEITDNVNRREKDWVCYNAECALCIRWAKRFRTLLEKHGFALWPLQSPDVRASLHMDERELVREMRVITRDGVVYGGADALLFISRVISKPAFYLSAIPGVKPLLRHLYRVVVANRNCFNGACRTRKTNLVRVGTLADWLPLVIPPVAAAVIGRTFPAWLYMWLLAFALFAGCKWLVFRKEHDRAAHVSFARKLGFLFGWIGMDATAFFEKTNAAKPRLKELGFATLKILFGTMLIWVVTPRTLTMNPLLAGWTGMVGLIFFLHFGLFHLLLLAWRAAGIPATPLMRAPLLSCSLGEFWGERWNTAFNYLAATFLFRPLHRAVGVSTATLLVFLVSGLAHDLVISVPARGGYGLPTLYFLLQGAGVLFEHTAIARRIGIHRGFRGWLFTLTITAGPVFWLFHPAFIRNVILPFLNVIGAT